MTAALATAAANARSAQYIVLSATGTTLTTTAGAAPAGGSVGAPSSVTSTSATVAVTLTTLGFNSNYNYFLSSSPTNSTGGTMTNLSPQAALTTSQNASLTLLAPSTTSFLFVRAQDVKTDTYTFMTVTGNAAASITAAVAVTMTTLGSNANYVYYLSWCATNSSGGTMVNVCLLAAQTSSQTVYPSGLPAGTSPFLFVRAKDAITGAYIVMSASGTQIAMSASSIYYEAAALTASDATAQDRFGYSVAVDGSYAVTTIVNNPDPVTNDGFGSAVSISGAYAVVGCSAKDPSSKSGAGSTYLYKRNSTTGVWENKIEWVASDGAANDMMGLSVCISGTHVFSGAILKTVTGLAAAGGAYVYELPPSTVTLVTPSASSAAVGSGTAFDTAARLSASIFTFGTDATYSYVLSY
ncbi:hypothetical protein JKP88DRAFT_280502 [Tribonema minus]|uniref:Uncharacterized protein n=1 Tax=Tribonema minus TaxID=303371 RepID=A0A836CB32_9STRA|nr:hypothetical protein JKP88DRAFT_280502 [Tribonema minus]